MSDRWNGQTKQKTPKRTVYGTVKCETFLDIIACAEYQSL